jgi:hypothetical protein
MNATVWRLPDENYQHCEAAERIFGYRDSRAPTTFLIFLRADKRENGELPLLLIASN